MKKMCLIGCIIILSAGLFSCATTQTRQDRGTAVGAGVGAGVGAALGQVIGGDTESTLIGAGIGAALGGLAGNQIGRYMDNRSGSCAALLPHQNLPAYPENRMF